MAEMFSPTPEPEHDPLQPKIICDATKLTRTVAGILMFCWAWWWWNGHAGPKWVQWVEKECPRLPLIKVAPWIFL